MTNWSLILNVLLLVGVVFALLRMMSAKHRVQKRRRLYRTEPPHIETPQDDIIAVRKLRSEDDPACDLDKKDAPVVASSCEEPRIGGPQISGLNPESELKPESKRVVSAVEQADGVEKIKEAHQAPTSRSIMMFLLAKDNRQLAGYELLQTILAAGLRFGDGQLFHRHQFSNGQGPIICSLATATASGIFDLQNMGAFSVRGLCLFMDASGNPSIDGERLTIMLETAKQLSDGLDTHLLDDERAPWSDRSLARYHRLLGIASEETAYLD